MGHRRFYSIDNRFRRDKKSFDGNEEHRAAPKQLSGENVLHQLNGMEHITLGKTSKNKFVLYVGFLCTWFVPPFIRSALLYIFPCL